MTRLFFLLCFLVIPIQSLKARAHPPAAYLGWTDKVCIARVTASKNEEVSFSIIESVKGDFGKSLDLISLSAPNFQVGTDWMLIHTGGFKNRVGITLSGGCEWIPAAIVRKDKAIYIQTRTVIGSGIVLDTLPDGTEGLSLQHVRDILKAQPSKP